MNTYAENLDAYISLKQTDPDGVLLMQTEQCRGGTRYFCAYGNDAEIVDVVSGKTLTVTRTNPLPLVEVDESTLPRIIDRLGAAGHNVIVAQRHQLAISYLDALSMWLAAKCAEYLAKMKGAYES